MLGREMQSKARLSLLGPEHAAAPHPGAESGGPELEH